MTTFLRIKNWETHQHYKDRNPPWIKFHRAILDDYEFCALTDKAKAHLLLIWLLASQTDGRIPHDAKFIEGRISCTEISLDELIQSGFLILEQSASTNASSALASPEQVAPVSVRLEEKRREEKTMSGKPDVIEILNYLNDKANRKYKPVKASLGLIQARLLEGASADECRAVIDLKVNAWLHDPKMNQYLRPATLFNATKFAQYVGELGSAPCSVQKPVWER